MNVQEPEEGLHHNFKKTKKNENKTKQTNKQKWEIPSLYVIFIIIYFCKTLFMK